MTVELYAERRRGMGDPLKREARRANERWRTRIGASVRACREARKLTQAELGAAAGIDLMTVSKIERGIAAPDYATVETLADILRVPIDLLVGRMSPGDAAAQGLLDEADLRAFRITPGISRMISAARFQSIQEPNISRAEQPEEPLENRVDRLEEELLESVERQSKMLAAIQRLEAGTSASRKRHGKE
ncbi:helix-turn-helix domain-containing protein [bacterium]|nr:MAG: helix-turn-helix domain-containing protein [bacterium]